MRRLFVLLWSAAAITGFAQDHHHESSTNNAADHEAGHHSTAHEGGHKMEGFYGSYSMSRDASGTSWQPEATPHEGMHRMVGDWMFMFHAMAHLVYDHQGGRRGDDKIFSPNMAMLMAQHPLGSAKFGFRSMLSLEPATIGDTGYPLLLQTGETADGINPLIDRQHPHDLLMELAITYSHPVGANSSAFAYFGLPGEPALGPPAFMHRFSAMDSPEAPITHHWLDSTHITYGVATLGYVWKNLKLDGSIFTGREPDEERRNFDEPTFDSYSARISFAPGEAWTLQASYGWINSPELLAPDVNTERITVSIAYHFAWKENHWQTMFAWGQNRNYPGENLNAFLLESTVRFHDTHTIFTRAERVQKDELFAPGHPLEDEEFTVHKLSAGYIYDFPPIQGVTIGLGGLGSVHFLPRTLTPHYGETPTSFMLFARIKL